MIGFISPKVKEGESTDSELYYILSIRSDLSQSPDSLRSITQLEQFG